MAPSKYALQLKEIAEKEKQAQEHQLDRDELAANRTLKHKRVSAGAPHRKPAANQSSKPLGSTNAEPRAGPSSGLSQNVNGSEQPGRKAREEFVTKTINAATATANQVATPQQPPASNQPAAPTATSEAQPTGDEIGDGQPYDDDVDMDHNLFGKSDGKSDSESDGEIGLEQLKKLYKSRPTKAMKDALRTILEELSDTEVEQNAEQPTRKKRRAKSKSKWTQDDDFICTDGPRRRDQHHIILSGYIRPPPEVAAPTGAAFYFRWDESEKSEFNAIAARIVAARIVNEWPALFEIDEVFDMATGHFKYLCSCYRRQNIPEVAAKEPQQHCSANANTRKHTLYNHRLRIIKTIPALRRHGRLIETLGIDGTSSDEESARKGVYTVRRKRQLSSKFQHLKR
ncbi:hypothetical protein FRC08_000266 [Ceratobasidium sp. 394]|nr:hypothetical protein FRC08_000266 [Ceratobasidium sp. 394]